MSKKLKIFWKSRIRWTYAFSYWKRSMFPHLYEKLPDDIPEWWWDWWFWAMLNN